MQPLLDGPRASLTEAAVRGLLQSQSTIQITYGAEALDSSFAALGDISGYVSGGSITSSSDATVNRTCQIVIDDRVVADLGWSYLSGFVRPYQTFTDVATGVSAQFHLGVYTLTSPTRALGTDTPALNFAGYDLMYFLTQAVGDSYEVPTGADPAQAAADAIALAIPGVTVNVVPSGTTLTAQLTWPFDASAPVTWLHIVSDLLASIGYRQAWVDWDGNFRVEPWYDLQIEQPEWTFDMKDAANIVGDQRTQDNDLFDVPNWFRFVMADLPDTPKEGVTQFTWIDTSDTNPGSAPNRGIYIKHIESVSAPTYDNLVAYAQRVITSMLKPSETFTVPTQPFPLAWHLDIIEYIDSGLTPSLPLNGPGRRLVVATGWTIPLDGMSDMTWTWQTLTDQDAGLGRAVPADS